MYDYTYTYMRKSIPSILLWEGVWGNITQLHRWATHVTFIKLIISKAPCINFNLPAMPLISNILQRRTEVIQRCTCLPGRLLWHNSGNWLRPRSVDYCWTQWASKEEVNCLQYTKQIKLFKTYTAPLCVHWCPEENCLSNSWMICRDVDFSSVKLLNRY